MKYNKITYLDKIRTRKTSNKISDVFSCLTREVIEEPKKEEYKRETNYFKIQKELYLKGRLVKQKKLKRLVSLYKVHNQSIPPELLEYDTIKPKQNLKHRRKHKKLTNKKVKKERIPRKYNIYIKSKYWERRKNEYYRTHIKQCVVCQSYKQISVHHLDYKNEEFGNEKDEDLVAICWECHEEFHNKYGVTKNSHLQFSEFCYNKVNNPIII